MLFVVLLVIKSVYGRFLMARLLCEKLAMLRCSQAKALQMQVSDIGSVVLLQACISFIGCITRLSSKDSDSMCAALHELPFLQPTYNPVQVCKVVVRLAARRCRDKHAQT